jgi:hypothetical protein
MVEKSKKFKASDGKEHKVEKNKKGHIIVDHTAKKGGKWDKIDLTKKAGAKTISQGVKAVKSYHRKNG